jgi:outer membrane biogenesis lipoprotein LolB
MTMKKVLPLFFLAVLMLSACQPTPEEDIVVNKGDSSYIAATATGADPFSEVQSKYELSFSSDDQSVVVNIDASVKVPDIDRIPLAALTPRMFTQDEVDKIIGALMQNQPLYEPRGPESCCCRGSF